MTDSGPRDVLRDKFLGFFRLIEACREPGCPVCRCLAADSRQYLEALLYEQVNDPETRRRLHASWGFCNWHAWMLRETSEPAFGASILYEDLVGAAVRRFERLAGRTVGSASGLLGRLRRLLGRHRPLLATLYRRREACPACRVVADAEVRYLTTALRFIEDPQFDRAYARSQGLCVPHAVRALELAAGGPCAQQLIARTLPKWAALRRVLAQFVGKHDYRTTRPFTEDEGTAYLRAFATLAGAPGVFGNAIRTGESARRGRERPAAGMAPPEAAATGRDEGFERAKLELRVKELTEQLNEASSRAAALHYRLAQVAEDRNVLEMNVSGERAANELGQRVIAELRAEVERLRAELAALRSARRG
jgi:hypothetical protein